ncbi:MAG: hypothetical protein IJ313_13185 [Clostridia bacterium]|nr:hypothetical protein [Clostridia bacterium]
MKKNKVLAVVLALLVLALVAVVGVIVYKQAEYQAGEAFYESLRGAAKGWRVC